MPTETAISGCSTRSCTRKWAVGERSCFTPSQKLGARKRVSASAVTAPLAARVKKASTAIPRAQPTAPWLRMRSGGPPDAQ